MLCRVLWWSLRLAGSSLRSLVAAKCVHCRWASLGPGECYCGCGFRDRGCIAMAEYKLSNIDSVWREMYVGWRGRCKGDHRDRRFVIDW